MNSLFARQEAPEWDSSANNFFGFIPNIALASTYIAVFALLSILHTILSIRGRNWIGSVAIIGGLCQIAGWSARLAGHWKYEGLGPYLIQQCTLVIGPVFFSATCYALIGKMIPLVGAQWSYFKPRTFIIFFIVVDIVCLILQGTGGGMCGSADLGRKIYLAGISVQLVNTVLFAGLTAHYFYSMKKDTKQSIKAFGGQPLFKLFVGVMLCNVLIVLRNGFREAELSEGFDGRLATVEVYVACLDALPMALAFAALAYCHPYFTLNRMVASDSDSERSMLEKSSSQSSNRSSVVGESESGRRVAVPVV